MIIFDNSLYELTAANRTEQTETLSERLQKKVEKTSLKKLMKHGNISRKEAQGEYRQLCKQIEIQYGLTVIALNFDFDHETGLLNIRTYS
jgi:hypothetical protein